MARINSTAELEELRKSILSTRDASELVQLKLNIETSVGESTPTEAEYGGPLPLEEAGVLRLDKMKKGLRSGSLFSQYLYTLNLNLTS